MPAYPDHRKTFRYRSRRPADAALRLRLRELAAEQRRFGCRRLHVLLRAEGHVVNRRRRNGFIAKKASPSASVVVASVPLAREHRCLSRPALMRVGPGIPSTISS